MEIERINENTVKFYISYVDIEDRGFEKEEIWYNRERSEQLFWQMMEEVNYKEDFPVEGPLWIQVQALEKGLEIIVTKAQIPTNSSLDALEEVEGLIDITISDKAKSSFGNKIVEEKAEQTEEIDDDASIWLTTSFNDFEDVIQLSHYFHCDGEEQLETALYHYKNKYYLYMEIPAQLFEEQEDMLSQILEYSQEADETYYVLEEYGKVVMEKDVFRQVKKYFNVEQKIC